MNVASMESAKASLTVLRLIPRKADCFVTLLSILAIIPWADSHVFSHDDARSINGPTAKSFVDSLFQEYGTNKSMSLQQFSSLMKELKIGYLAREAKSKAGSAKENRVKTRYSEVRVPKMKRWNQTNQGGGRAKHSVSADSIRVYNLQEKASMKTSMIIAVTYRTKAAVTFKLYVNTMIIDAFISFSAVQIYDLSYIHLHSSPSMGVLRTHKLTSSQLA